MENVLVIFAMETHVFVSYKEITSLDLQKAETQAN